MLSQHSRPGWCVQIWAAGCCWFHPTWHIRFLQPTLLSYEILSFFCLQLTLHVYTVCVHMCMSCLCASSLSCEAAALPAAILLPCRMYPSVNPHQSRSMCASSHMHGDVGCIETSMKKRSLTQDVAITCFKRQWTSCNTVTKSVNLLMLQPKYLTFREFIFKNQHFTISFQITNRSEMAANHLSSNIWWFESVEGSYTNRSKL